jgi:hypothetical protein
MTKNTIIQNDVLLLMALFLAPFGIELIRTNFWQGIACFGIAAAFVAVRTILKIDANK